MLKCNKTKMQPTAMSIIQVQHYYNKGRIFNESEATILSHNMRVPMIGL